MKKGKIIKLVLSTLGIALIIGAMITSDILPPLKEVGASCSMTLMSQA